MKPAVISIILRERKPLVNKNRKDCLHHNPERNHIPGGVGFSVNGTSIYQAHQTTSHRSRERLTSVAKLGTFETLHDTRQEYHHDTDFTLDSHLE